MIEYTVGSRGVTFLVRVAPRASASEIIGEYDGALKIRIAAPPVEGAANRELVRLLAKRLKVQQSLVEIISGAGAKTKVILLKDSSADTLERLRSFGKKN